MISRTYKAENVTTVKDQFNENNTTWFSECRTARDIRMISDLDGGLLISEFDYTYPIWIYDVSRADIGYDQKKARQLRRQYE